MRTDIGFGGSFKRRNTFLGTDETIAAKRFIENGPINEPKPQEEQIISSKSKSMEDKYSYSSNSDERRVAEFY